MMNLETDEVQFKQMDNGQWELKITLEDGRELYHYMEMIDGIYEQCMDMGIEWE